MVTQHASWTINPQDPRAPSTEVWDRLSPEERARIVAALPSEFPASETSPPEGDLHLFVQTRALDSLREFFGRMGRRIYVAGDIPVYYPGEPMFAADLVAVLDVDPHFRNSWVVSHEGKGLDLAMEIHVAGNWKKDSRDNPVRYARLGIQEYFVFDVPHERLLGFRLPEPHANSYVPIVPQRGLWESRVLQLDLSVRQGRVRFSHAGAVVPESKEMLDSLGQTLTAVNAKREELERALEEARAGEQEAKARRAAEQALQEERQRAAEEIARLKAEVERLRKG